MSRWTREKYTLAPPSLHELAGVLQDGLATNFAAVSVTVARSPDLRAAPFSLAAEGLSGHERIGDVGGVYNLRPLPRLDHVYDLRELMDQMEMGDGLVIGAGAGPFRHVGVNCELMPNVYYANGAVNNQTHYAKVVSGAGGVHGAPLAYTCQPLPSSTGCAMLANLYGSDGLPGDVLHIVASGRTGELNFADAVRAALQARYSQPVSVGGVFVLRRGKAKVHVMSDFPAKPRPADVDDGWLKYFEAAAPLTCLSVLNVNDPGLHLHPGHTHCFSEHGQGGHYHYDTTPADVEYEAYFNTAKAIYRIDGPEGH